MKIKTDNLTLIPLDAEKLGFLTDNLPALEKALGITYKAEPMKGDFLQIVRGQLEITKNDSVNYAWHSFWLIVRDSDNVCVGSADFKDVPDKNGEVEIGYGLGEGFCGNGYMTEAASAMCGWALEQPGVSAVIAETETNNIKSQNVLLRCGFSEYSRGETVMWRKANR